MRHNTTKDLFDDIANAWSAPIVSRAKIGEMTGGLISPKTLANLHAKGEGPPCDIYRGRAIYRVETFVPWLRTWATKGRSKRRDAKEEAPR